jgi:F-type H+-transporting ATPase subunit delta
MSVRLFSDSRHKRPDGLPPVKKPQHQEVKKEKMVKKGMTIPAATTTSPSSNRPPAPPPRPLYFSGTIGKMSHQIFDAAVSANELERVNGDLSKLLDNLNKDTQVQSQLASPIIRKDDKVQIAQRFASGSSELVIKLLERMVNENRFRDFKTVVSNYSRLMAEKLGHVTACVYSVEPLTNEQLQKIEEKMTPFLEKGQKLVLTTQLSPKLLGGLKIRIGDRELDLSVLSKIKQFEQVFKTSLKG